MSDNSLIHVLEAIDSEKIVSQSTGRYANAKKDVRKILEMAGSEVFSEFSAKLVEEVSKCFFQRRVGPSAGIDREKALMAFASTRVDVLPGLWSAFYVAIGLPIEDPLLSQMINRRVFDDFLIKRQSVSIDSPAVPSVAMSVDEENAVRYAAGFVPFRLIKKFSKLAPNDKHSRFVQCLKSMSAHINHALSRASFTYSH